DLLVPQGEDATQDQFCDPLGVLLGVGQGQAAAPGPTEDLPCAGTDHLAQPVDVLHQRPRGVRGQVDVHSTGVGGGTSAVALVEQQDLVPLGVEQPPVVGVGAPSGTAVQEHHRFAGGVAAPLPADMVSVTDVAHAGVVRCDGRVLRARSGVAFDYSCDWCGRGSGWGCDAAA